MSTDTATPPTAIPLSDLVRERTSALHDRAESGNLLGELLGETVLVSTHIELLEQLLFVYRALENGADALRAQGSDIDHMLDTALYRTAGIEADLAELVGADWEQRIQVNPPTAGYVADIDQAVAAGNTPAFLGHHYTRYIGDLSGGLMIGHNIRRRTGLGADGAAGLRFYKFDEITHPKAYKDNYRVQINTLTWNDAQREEFCNASVRAYGMNADLFGGILARREESAGE